MGTLNGCSNLITKPNSKLPSITHATKRTSSTIDLHSIHGVIQQEEIEVIKLNIKEQIT